MNRQQIADIYDSMTPEEQNMPREEFIKQTMQALGPKANKQTLDAMVERKHQQRMGEMQRARIDAALERGQG